MNNKINFKRFSNSLKRLLGKLKETKQTTNISPHLKLKPILHVYFLKC